MSRFGGGDAAVDLEIELHHRPEALQERLLAERAVERAGLDLLLLLRAEIEAVGADLVAHAELGHRVADRRGDEAVGAHDPDHVAAALDQADDRARGVVGVDVDADVLRAGVDLEVAQLAGDRQRRHGRR